MMWGRAIGVAGWLRLTTLVAAATAPVLLPAPAGAQSAADKATARQLAVEGIKQYGEGKYEEALDKMQRAQSLYDAPIHQLYIARCQAKLGKLVDAAETYRALARVNLAPGAPEAFRQAQEDGAREFQALEPKIPTLKIEIDPPNLQGLQLTIDGVAVSSAVIGIDRPINPGQHQIEVSAPGYEPSASSIAVKKGDQKTAKLTLQPATGATPLPPGQQPPPDQQPPGQYPPSQQYPPPGQQPPPGQPPPPEEDEPGGIGFLIGVRLVGVVPLGGLDTNFSEAYPDGVPASLGQEEMSFSEAAEGGGGLELQAGVRFAKHFTPFVIGGVYGLKAGAGLEKLGFAEMDYERTFYNPSMAYAEGIESSPTMLMGGLGIRLGTPRGQLGGFGEAAFVMHLLQARQTVTFEFGAENCEVERNYSGGALRLGGGAAIPVGKIFQLSPFAMASVGKFTTAEVKAQCIENEGYDYNPEGSIHALLAIGVGGEFLFGSDTPRSEEPVAPGPAPGGAPPPAAAPTAPAPAAAPAQ